MYVFDYYLLQRDGRTDKFIFIFSVPVLEMIGNHNSYTTFSLWIYIYIYIYIYIFVYYSTTAVPYFFLPLFSFFSLPIFLRFMFLYLIIFVCTCLFACYGVMMQMIMHSSSFSVLLLFSFLLIIFSLLAPPAFPCCSHYFQKCSKLFCFLFFPLLVPLTLIHLLFDSFFWFQIFSVALLVVESAASY